MSSSSVREVMFKKYQNKLFCFSPPVMIATCVIEVCLLAYTIWRYRLNTLSRLVVTTLGLLAVFQLAEFHVCRLSGNPALWSHVGYVAITLLPPLGIHIIHTIKGKRDPSLVIGAYLIAAAFVGWFVFSAHSLNGHQCLGNYVMFQVNPGLTDLYGLYYYGWVIVAISLSLRFAQQAKAKKQQQALYGVGFGLAAFLIPTTTANLLDKATLKGIPSIMCGFAVILAITLVGWVMPRVGKRRQSLSDTPVKPA